MAKQRLEIGEEVGAKKAFAWAVDWPGWCRSGKDATLARAALIDYARRYVAVAKAAGLELPDVDGAELAIVESVDGGGGTDFGVPSAINDHDRQRVAAAEAARLAKLVEASWTVLDRVSAKAPAELRKGPRGGGRDSDKMIAHVIESDHYYGREIGVRVAEPDPKDRKSVAAERAAILEVLGQPSDGSPLADRKWTLRYAARRIAWHALDHAWEMEDRSTPDEPIRGKDRR